jgi:hypothetical protein
VLIWFVWVVAQLAMAALKTHRMQEASIAEHRMIISNSANETERAVMRVRDSARRRALRAERLHKEELRRAQSELDKLKRVLEGEVLTSIDDRVRTIAGIFFEPEWRNLHESYWLIGPITIENRKSVAVTIDGALEASHGEEWLRFDVEGTAFQHWQKALRSTHQASAPQITFPTGIAPHASLRGIALLRFPSSELGGFGKYREANQQLRFVLTLNGSEGRWIVPLRLPSDWNPKATEDVPSRVRRREPQSG